MKTMCTSSLGARVALLCRRKGTCGSSHDTISPASRSRALVADVDDAASEATPPPSLLSINDDVGGALCDALFEKGANDGRNKNTAKTLSNATTGRDTTPVKGGCCGRVCFVICCQEKST
jgi:hypothetical protein